MSHNERCKECKKRIHELLEKIYGSVIPNYRIELSTKPDSLRNHPRYQILNAIFLDLVNHRGYTDFVKASYVDVDFFLPVQKLIIEFDESQHFTEPRKIALSHYPSDLEIGFSREIWMKHCDEITATDNDPPFRDEQRAWYDTLRDFLPEEKGFHPTVRLYAKDMAWCDLNPEKFEDIEKFRNIIEGNSYPVKNIETSPWSIKSGADQYFLDAFIRFEYLLNKLKLHYLIDCFEGKFNYESPYLRNPNNNQKVLNTPSGRAIKAYFNMRVQYVGYEGPLIKDCNPTESKLVADVNALNDLLKQIISTSDNWFALFCEYLLIKTVVHEIYVDTVYEENKHKYGLPTFESLFIENEGNKEINTFEGSNLRNYTINALLLGIDPSGNLSNQPLTPEYKKAVSFDQFLSQREEWIGIACREINKMKDNMTNDRLTSVINWKNHSLCAFDAGPVFIRKRKEFLVPAFCQSISGYEKWDSPLSLRKKLDEAINDNLAILIGSYWEFFHEGQNLQFIENNRHYAEFIRKTEKELDARFQALDVTEFAEIKKRLSGLVGTSRDVRSSFKQISKMKPTPRACNERINQIADIFDKKNTILPRVKLRRFNNRTQVRFFHPEWPKIDNKSNQSIFYEINDWNCCGKEEIRIEIQFWDEFFCEIAEEIHERSESIRDRLPLNPSPEWNTKTSAGLSRLQYLYDDTVDLELIAQGIEILIKVTQDVVNKWLKAKQMGHY